jgi:hypothetical protein
MAALVSSSSSVRKAGRTSTRARATPAPALPNQCRVPAGTSTVSPGPARIVRRPRVKRRRPATTVNRSVWIGWTWPAGTWPPGGRNRSKASSRPSVCAPLVRTTMCSPLTGLTITRRSTGVVLEGLPAMGGLGRPA